MTSPSALWLHSHLPSPLCPPSADVPKGKVGKDGNRRTGWNKVRVPPCSKSGTPCVAYSQNKRRHPSHPPTSAVWGRHCQTETSAMPRAASSNCPSLRLSTLASPGVQLSCEGELLNSTGLPHHDRWSLGSSAKKVIGRGHVPGAREVLAQQ